MITNIISQLKSTSGRNDKISLLEAEKDNANLKTILRAALDPYVTFFITEVPEVASDEVREDIEDHINSIDPELKEEAICQLLEQAMSSNDRGRIKDLFYVMSKIAENDKDLQWLINAVLKKDLDCGVGASTVNKVWPKLINEFKVMKAEEGKHVGYITYPARCDLKMDGVAAFLIYKNGSIEIKSSSGKTFGHLPTIHKDAMDFAERVDGYHDGFVLCGELIAHDEEGNRKPRQESNGISYKALLGTINEQEEQSLKLYVYDMLSSSSQLERGVDPKPLSKRMDEFAWIDEYSHVVSVPYVEVDSYEDAMKVVDEWVAEGEEGAILKNLESIYESKRSKDWVKIKKEITIDVRITDWTRHTKKEDQLGSMTVALDGLSIVGKIGTKLTEKQRKEMYEMAMRRELVGKVIEITCHEITFSKSKNKHSFYLPRFNRFRWDKQETDTFEKVMAM